MRTTNKHSLNELVFNSLGKGSHFDNETEILYNYLKDNVATASMVSKATGIPQKNICRYKRDLEQLGKLWIVRIGKCQDTGCDAGYLTTNPALAPRNYQLSLFD